MKRVPLVRRTPLDGRGELVRRTQLPPRSAKRAREYAQPGTGRRALVARLLAERTRCELRIVCRGARAVDVHERLSRARGGSILDPGQAHMVTVCRSCHEWVGAHPADAERRRALLPSWHVCPPCGPC